MGLISIFCKLIKIALGLHNTSSTDSFIQQLVASNMAPTFCSFNVFFLLLVSIEKKTDGSFSNRLGIFESSKKGIEIYCSLDDFSLFKKRVSNKSC